MGIELLHRSDINHRQSMIKENNYIDLNLNLTTEEVKMTSTLPNVFDGDLIPPLPRNWHEKEEQQWKEMYWENSDSSEEYSRPKHIEIKDKENLVPSTKEGISNREENDEKYVEESQFTNSQTIKYEEDSEEPPYESGSDTDIFPFHIPKN